MRKRIFAFVLALLLLTAFIPAAPQTAYADEDLSWTDEECPKAKELGYDPPIHDINWETLQQGNCTVETITKVYCSICGRSSTTRYAPGHDWDEGVVTKEATCTEAGEITYTCHRLITNTWCGQKKTESIPALGHNWDGGKVTKAATCTEAGVKTYTCSRCGNTKTESIAKTGHNYGAWSTTKEATCTAEGQRERTCKVCGNKQTEKLSKTAHTPADAPAVEATCTEPGHGTASVCSVCGTALSEAEAYPPLGHLWDGGKVTKLPTETEEGEVTYICQRDPGHTKTAKLPATGTEPNPKAWLSITWAEDAGKGKCYEGAKVPIQKTVVNIGNVPITVKFAGGTVTLQPKEYTTWDDSWIVGASDVAAQKYVFLRQVAFRDLDGRAYFTNMVEGSIPLTYPDGTTPPEPAPSVKLELVPENAIKDVYPHDGGDSTKSEIIDFGLDATNTGNVPLDLYWYWLSSAKDKSPFQGLLPTGSKVQPGKSCTTSHWAMAYSKWVTPEPEDSPYFGSRTMEWYVVGYAPGADPNKAKPLCESNHIIRTYKIARPEAEDWKLPEDGLVKKFIKKEFSHPSDPNGYQVGERIDYFIRLTYLYPGEEIEGFSDLVLDDPNAYDAYNEELNQNGHLHIDYAGKKTHAYGKSAIHFRSPSVRRSCHGR